MLIFLDKEDAETLIDILDWHKRRESLICTEAKNLERSKREQKLCEDLTSTLRALL